MSEDVGIKGETCSGKLETAIEGGSEFTFGEYCWLFSSGKGKSIPVTNLRSC